MEIFGGFMVMMSIIGLFLAIIWLIMPFVVFAVKGKLERSLDILEGIEKRLDDMDSQLKSLQSHHAQPGQAAAVPEETEIPGSDHSSGQQVLPLA